MKKDKDNKSHSVNVRFRQEDYEYLLAKAKAEMLTVSAIVRTIIMNTIKQKKGKSKT